jgi:hypothetical protein
VDDCPGARGGRLASPYRLLVIDESLNPRLSGELTGRGRSAAALAQLGLVGALDSELLDALAGRLEAGWTLVTADDHLPAEHRGAFGVLEASAATLDPRQAPGYSLDEWRRELVHRFAHQMETQRPGEIRRYSLTGGKPWRSRGRRG